MSRELADKLFTALSWVGVGLSCSILLFLFAVIAWNGARAVDLRFLFTASRDFGAAGGIFYQILGSLLLVVVAALICLPIALGTALFKSEYMKRAKTKKLCALLVYGLNGVPSIIFGIFGLLFFVNILGTGISWLVGSVILAIMMLPTVVLATYHAVSSIPVSYRESASALGLNKWQVITKVLLPQGIGGAITGLFLGLARAVGETAPIMFIATAFSGVKIPGSVFEPVVALPTHILLLAQQATHPQALKNAWGASFVLIALVTLFSVLGLWSRVKTKTVTTR
ncbi:MAG: phosphate ABC transporter permease PstA [Calditrichaeota bacterium]|nr:MAG: phosphate ABC transporter permease PstA [Calditrichota bacterium]